MPMSLPHFHNHLQVRGMESFPKIGTMIRCVGPASGGALMLTCIPPLPPDAAV